MSGTKDALVLALDASTTACKALVFDLTGRVVAQGRAEIALDNPEPDGWEQDAEQWWDSARRAMAAAAHSLSPRDRQRVTAACITHQRETIVLTDDLGTPLTPALVWMDGRCRGEVERAVAHLGARRLHETTGKPPCTTPSLYKLLYLLRRRPELRSRAHVADVHVFLTRRLIGRSVTSRASADPWGMLDMTSGDWAEPLLALVGIDAERLPELVDVGSPLGTLDGAVARTTGWPEELRLYAGLGDGQAACLGAGVSGPGRAYLNLGTAVVSGVLTERYAVSRAFRTLHAARPGHFCLETDLKGGTFTLNWLLEKLLGRSRSAEEIRRLEAEAAPLAPGSDGLLVVPYWCGVMNPFWNDAATGVVLGWHGGHGPAHVYRAVLEGIAFEQRLHLEGVEDATGVPIDEIVVLGGGSESELWCRILADVLGKRVVRAESSEATALGAALVAAVGHGLVEEHEAVARMTRLGVAFEPGPARAHYERLYQEVYRGLFTVLESRLDALAGLRREAETARSAALRAQGAAGSTTSNRNE